MASLDNDNATLFEDSLLGSEPLAIGDLIMTEVLQGFDSDRDFNQVVRHSYY